MRFDNLQDWLQWQESCHPSDIELGLDRVGSVARQMSLTLGRPRVVTVAGTNGKGSCVATLNALLLSAGFQVGCFTSPHFLHYNERVVVNGEPVSDQLLMDAFQRIDSVKGETPLTYFEFGTLAAIDIFQRADLDVVLLEVGLGGRLDAVNIIDADIAVVTSIDVDHQEWLGSDREQIAFEKAGIFRPGRPAISAGSQPPETLRHTADTVGAVFYQAGETFVAEPETEEGEWCWRGVSAFGEAIQLQHLPPLSLPRESVAAALQVLYLLDVPLEGVDFQCLKTVSLPGRFQSMQAEGKQLILDVAHNPAAANYLAEQLKNQACNGRTIALVGLMADKDVDGIITALQGCFDAWFVADLKQSSRAMPASELAEKLGQQGIGMISVSKNVRQAYRRALSLMGPDDRLIVFGSFITVAEVLQLQSRPRKSSRSQDS